LVAVAEAADDDDTVADDDAVVDADMSSSLVFPTTVDIVSASSSSDS
jgi:hypothetical protein